MQEDDEFWVVWKDGGSAPTYRHASLIAASREAERLCKLHGGRFYVLNAVSFVERNDIRIVPLRKEMPF